MSFSALIETAPVAAFMKDHDGRYQFANPYLLAMMGEHMGSDWRGKTDADLWPPEAAAQLHRYDAAILGGAGPQVFSRVMPHDGSPHTVLLIEFPMPDGDRGVGVGGLAVDVTEVSRTQAEHARLVAMTDRTPDSVVVVDLAGRITYVNAAFEKATGYSRDEVIGENPRILKSGLQTAASYQEMWATLVGGLPWSGEFINRRKDGTFIFEQAVIVPIGGVDGTPTGYVAVKHDVTNERAQSTGSALAASQHALILEVVRELLPGATPEATAHEICLKVAGLAGVAAAQILAFEHDGSALPIGQVVARRPDQPLLRLSVRLSRRLHARAMDGPWIEPWANRQGRGYDQLVEHAGPSALAYAPITFGERLVGLLVVQSVDVTNKDAAADLLPIVTEFADLAGALLGGSLTGRVDTQAGREHVLGIIANQAFSPVFQPIFDMFLGRVVGYEALTRFTDGSDPETVFGEAVAVHLGVPLEVATLKAALAAAKALPQGLWLNVNASAEFILAAGQLRFLLGGYRRPIVIEVTEHEAVADYALFRAAVASLGPSIRLAVDDAGAGFASLRHILELRPAMVKLDRWLIEGLDSDTARQAMIVGLHHFARKSGCLLIAEGVDTDQEIAVLRTLDIHLGQGYALGPPLPVDAIVSQTSRSSSSS